MFIKNISENSVTARVMGVKTLIEADEVVEMTKDEAENVLSLYPKIFAVANVQKLEKEDNSNNDEIPLQDMTKQQLKEYAEKIGIELDEKKKKDDMLVELSEKLKEIEEMQNKDIL